MKRRLFTPPPCSQRAAPGTAKHMSSYVKVVVLIFSGPGCRMAAHPASRVSGRRPPRRASSRQCLAARLATLPSHIARAISLDVAGRGSAYIYQRGGLLQLHVGERLPAAGEPVKSCSVRSPAIVDVASVVSMTDNF